MLIRLPARSVFISPTYPDQETSSYIRLDFILLVKTSIEKKSSFPVNRSNSPNVFSSLNPKLAMHLALVTACTLSTNN